MRLRDILEQLSRETWSRLRDAKALNVRFGEETVTDLMMLDLQRTKPKRSRFLQTPKKKESVSGTDFEWWLGTDTFGWLRLAVQAKRINTSNGRYGGITHQVAGTPQIQLLENYAYANGAVPLYCLYNHTNDARPANHWHCCRDSYDEEQLGCTIASLSTAKRAYATRGGKSFQSLHKYPSTIPLRCLADCPKIQRRLSSRMNEYQGGIRLDAEVFPVPMDAIRYDSLPERLVEARETGELEALDSDFYDPEVGLPRRIVVLDVEEGNDE